MTAVVGLPSANGGSYLHMVYGLDGRRCQHRVAIDQPPHRHCSGLIDADLDDDVSLDSRHLGRRRILRLRHLDEVFHCDFGRNANGSGLPESQNAYDNNTQDSRHIKTEYIAAEG